MGYLLHPYNRIQQFDQVRIEDVNGKPKLSRRRITVHDWEGPTASIQSLRQISLLFLHALNPKKKKDNAKICWNE